MTKKLIIGILTFTFVVAFLGLFQLGVPKVEAAGSQQGSTAVTLSVTSYFDSNNIVPATNLPSASYGATFAFDTNLATLENYEFAFWVVNGVVRQDLAVNNTFTLTYKNEFQAVFRPTNKYSVAFMDTNGQILKVQYVDKDGTADATAPTAPTKPGLLASGWTLGYENVTGNIITTATYSVTNSSEYAVTVNNGSGDGNYVYNTVATVVADAPASGLKFHHWEVDDLTVSYQATYKFTVLKAVTITAYYINESTEVTDLPTVTLSNNTGLRTAESKKTYVGQYYLPTGYTFVEAGILTHATNTAMIDITTSGVIRQQATRFTTETKEYLMTIANANAACARGYLIAKKTADNSLVTVYSENAYNVLNGGFETGTIYGWNSYRIRPEDTYEAWNDNRVVNTGYFDQNYTYSRVGNYNLGIYGGSISKDSGQARMGHLRSSDFILGGSGWISFRLGGGKTTSLAYVSVRKTSDNTEVARFGNRHFNDTSKATTQYRYRTGNPSDSIANAEAFLFQYYFDLSSYLGTSLYFVISDTASDEWCVLSADAFVSYLPTIPTEPTTNSDTLAVDIKPSIYQAGSAPDNISNKLTANVTNWENPNNVFRWDGGAGRTNNGGDGALGVARSPAFTIGSTNTYLKWDWHGSIRDSRKIFISVKEVGTNIEVMRLIRRDNLSNKADGNFDNHFYNLAGLSSSKEYYIELTDNLNAGWGLNGVYNIELVASNHGKVSVSGDMAVLVTGVVTNYVYVKPSALS